MSWHARLFQIFILFLPTQLSLHFWPQFSYVFGIRVDYLAPALYFTDLLLLATLATWFLEDRKAVYILTKYWKWGIALFVFLLVNTYFSHLPILSFYKWLRIGFVILLVLYAKHQKDLIALIKTPLALSIIFTLFLATAQILRNGSLGGVLYWLGERNISQSGVGIALFNLLGTEVLRPYATFSHPNTLSGFALVAFFLLIAMQGKLAKVGAASALVLVIISFSQNAWGALLAAPFVMLLIRKSKKHFQNFLYSAAVLSFVSSLAALKLASGNFSQEIGQRITLNLVAGKLIAGSPVVGTGLGVFTSLIPFSLGITNIIWWLQPAHNIFLLLAAEIGILGLLLFVVLIIKNTRAKNTLILIAIILTGMLDHYWLTQIQTLYLFAVVLGLSGTMDE